MSDKEKKEEEEAIYGFKEFYIACERTWNNQELNANIDHACLGLFDEAGEICSAVKKEVGYGKKLDLVNLKEEIGDYAYFLITLAYHWGERVNKTIQVPKGEKVPSLDEIREKVFKTANQALHDKQATTEDDVKNNSFTGLALGVSCLSKDVYVSSFSGRAEEFMVNLQNTIAALKILSIKADSTLIDNMKLNTEKLKARFPEKFTKSNATDRNLKKERKILDE